MKLNEYSRQCAGVIAGVYEKNKIVGRLSSRVCRSSRFLTFPIELADPNALDKAMKVADSIALGCRSSAVVCRVNRGVLAYDVALPESYWKKYDKSSLPGLGIGVSAGGSTMEYSFDVPNLLVAGVPGSGKTECMKTILYSVVTSTSPDSVELLIIDPHGALGMFSNVPHLEMPIATMGEEPSIVLKRLYAILEERRRLGEERVRSNGMPRVLLVIDEANADNVLGTKGNRNKENTSMLEQIVRQGRKFRINTIVGTQKPADNGIVDLIPYRIVGKVSDAHSAARLTGVAGTDANKLTGSGDMLYIFGRTCQRFQAALVNDWGALPQNPLGMGGFEEIDPDIYERDDEEEDISLGRPAEPLDPAVIGAYILDRPSIRKAKEKFGLGRHLHRRYTEAAQVIREVVQWTEE